MNFDFSIFVPLVPFIMGFFLKTLLDLNLAPHLIKTLSHIPVRSIYRIKSPDICGLWIQLWEINDSEKYVPEVSRKSELKISQFGKYFYGEFRSNNDEQYAVFGEIRGMNLLGTWYDKKNEFGYYGAFELKIIDNNLIKGKWLGHSSSDLNQIKSNEWNWSR
ncbi:hypothetical protein BV902_13125 [Sphingobacterium sp. B29]|uniref:hypothetical protein n=1 Tax=Sphingobacterium sp. B29 TaxID=1933220 RepID=UPI0009581E64|nr:hypothetical protein [Sphingobacterium sp. B29]APU97173.1 hypothetical protein BV902_13125 [Sphingobacterium sp. B29]